MMKVCQSNISGWSTQGRLKGAHVNGGTNQLAVHVGYCCGLPCNVLSQGNFQVEVRCSTIWWMQRFTLQWTWACHNAGKCLRYVEWEWVVYRKGGHHQVMVECGKKMVRLHSLPFSCHPLQQRHLTLRSAATFSCTNAPIWQPHWILLLFAQ